MARIDVLMPQMGESIAEGTLSKWLKKLGDEVKRDEPLFEISTDKGDAEIPAPSPTGAGSGPPAPAPSGHVDHWVLEGAGRRGSGEPGAGSSGGRRRYPAFDESENVLLGHPAGEAATRDGRDVHLMLGFIE